MKRYKHDVIKFTVLINLDYVLETIAANEVNHPLNVRKKNKLNETKLAILNDIVDTALSAIRSAGFEITKKYQSKKSYTYYIWFQPISQYGEKLTPVEVEFRISGDHNSKTLEDNETYSKVIVKSIIIGPEEYDNPAQVLQAFDDMCEGLKHGDSSILYRYAFNG